MRDSMHFRFYLFNLTFLWSVTVLCFSFKEDWEAGLVDERDIEVGHSCASVYTFDEALVLYIQCNHCVLQL